MANLRLWHASRDPYHCAFRLLRLTLANGASIEVERFRIIDMYLLYPSLLHTASMPREVRAEYGKLGVPPVGKIFLQLPSAASIFQDLRIYQNSAIAQLAARGILAAGHLKDRRITLVDRGVPEEMLSRARDRNAEESAMVEFLVGPFSQIPLRGNGNIYKKAGLPSRGIPT